MDHKHKVGDHIVLEGIHCKVLEVDEEGRPIKVDGSPRYGIISLTDAQEHEGGHEDE